jgi:epoxide hydrolase-like predicted phosphatase
MTIRAVVFDIGGVLEYTPRLGITEKWEQKLDLSPGELDKRLYPVWKSGSIGTMTEAEVLQGIRDIIGISEENLTAFTDDIWREYLGTLNVELTNFFSSLQGSFKTAIVSNSFVGAREREQDAYRFQEMTEFIIYSHEVGISKPDPRIFEMLIERLSLKPDEIIYLDDVDVHVNAAHALGIHAIQFIDNAQAIADIQACIQSNAS